MDKIRELIHLQNFKEICPFFPGGEINCYEEPDFIIDTSDIRLGIEHTQIFQPDPLPGTSLIAHDKNAQDVVNRAYSFYVDHHNQCPSAQIFFYPKVMIRKSDLDLLAEKIVYLIEKTPLDPNSVISIKRNRENSEYFPCEIARLCVNTYSNVKENKWNCSSVGWIPDITPEYLQQKINQKNQKVDVYKLNCSEIWLLIVANYSRNPSVVDLSEQAIIHTYSTRFDRIFFFWNGTRQYKELHLTNNCA